MCVSVCKWAVQVLKLLYHWPGFNEHWYLDICEHQKAFPAHLVLKGGWWYLKHERGVLIINLTCSPFFTLFNVVSFYWNVISYANGMTFGLPPPHLCWGLVKMCCKWSGEVNKEDEWARVGWVASLIEDVIQCQGWRSLWKWSKVGFLKLGIVSVKDKDWNQEAMVRSMVAEKTWNWFLCGSVCVGVCVGI